MRNLINKRRLYVGTGLALAFLIGGVTVIVMALILPSPDQYGLDKVDFTEKSISPPQELVIKTVAQRPNIIFVLADDLGYGDVEAYGATSIRTPNINQLAEEGARFTDFYAPAPVCSPSRAGYLTGRYPLRMGISFPFQPAQKKSVGTWVEGKFLTMMAALGTADLKSGGNLVNGLPPSELTIAEGLKQAGYATGVVGKWHLGDFKKWPEYHPFRNGFDWFVGFNASNDDWPVAFYRGDEEILADIGLDQKQYTQMFTDEALTFIERNKDQPFFLFFSHKDPHQPFFPSDAFAGKSRAGKYGDAVEELDGSLGQVLAQLERLGLEENTIVIFTSDNGPWYEGSPGGLRGRKGMSYEGGSRVPFLIRSPHKIEPGSVRTFPAMGIDLLPTVFALAGIELPTDRVIDGIALVDGDGALLPDDIERGPLYFSSGFDFEAIRHGPLKLIDRNSTYGWPIPLDKSVGLAAATAPRYSPEGSDLSIARLNHWPKLYDVTIDPSESYDILDGHPDDADRLESELEKWRQEFGDSPRGLQ